jgi:flavin-dependent dehydrogenase
MVAAGGHGMTAQSCIPAGGALVPATLSREAAETRPWQAVIVGAGPAGAATALRLARAGVAVLLVDREALPRGKVCGCCLSAAAIDEIDRLGPEAAADVRLRRVPLDIAVIAAGGRLARVPLPGGAVVSREALDASLVRAAIAAGADWLPGIHVQAIHEDAAALIVAVEATVASTPLPAAADACRGLLTLRAETVVVAAGLADHVRIGAGASRRGRRVAEASRIGLGTTLEPTAASLPAGELLMAIGREGYCGVVRLEDGRIDVAAALDRGVMGRACTPGEAVSRLLHEADPGSGGLAAAVLAATVWRATPALTHEAPVVATASGRILRVGDSAGYVEPFTGEGIGWALAAARILVGSLTAAATPGALGDPRAAAADYARDHARHFGTRHGRCRRVAAGLRLPALVRGAVTAARLAPWAARRLVPAVVGAAPHADHA